MGVPTSEVGYTIATTRRETTKVYKSMWWQWGGQYILHRKKQTAAQGSNSEVKF